MKHQYERTTLDKAHHQLLLHELVSVEHELSDLRQVLHAAPEAILITNLSAEIIYVNPAWEKLTGYSFDEVSGKNPKLLQSGKTPREVYKKLWHNLKNNQSFTQEKMINRRKDGTEFNAHATTFPVIRFDTPIYYVQFLHDVTDSKKEEFQRQELLSTVAHELKTPITVLKLLLSSRIQNIERFSIADLKLMDKELDRLISLINESLDISRIYLNRLHLDLSIFNINRLVEEVYEQISIISEGHKIIVESVPDLVVTADYNRVKQVLFNFLTNAIKYSPIGTTVKIKVRKVKHTVVVSVKNNGMGIPEERLPFVFDKFFQVKNKSTEGLGLGLYISAQIIHKHKGKIWVQSDEGEGATFYFSLPLKV